MAKGIGIVQAGVEITTSSENSFALTDGWTNGLRRLPRLTPRPTPHGRWIRILPAAGFVLGLTHSPDNLPYCDRLGVAFAIAGHTHGGKLRIPGIGAVLVPSKLGRFLDEGWFRRGTTLLYLTRGIGYFPGLFGIAGEICWFTLRQDATGTSSRCNQ